MTGAAPFDAGGVANLLLDMGDQRGQIVQAEREQERRRAGVQSGSLL